MPPSTHPPAPIDRFFTTLYWILLLVFLLMMLDLCLNPALRYDSTAHAAWSKRFPQIQTIVRLRLWVVALGYVGASCFVGEWGPTFCVLALCLVLEIYLRYTDASSLKGSTPRHIRTYNHGTANLGRAFHRFVEGHGREEMGVLLG